MATNSNQSSIPSMIQPTSEPPQPEPSSSSSSSSTPTPASPSSPKCAHCSVSPGPEPAEGSGDKPPLQLKPCPKCHTTLYCSRDCQKAAFKVHKKTCAASAQEYAKTANMKMAAPSGRGKDGRRGGLQKWQFDT
ncbi:hypothetical protein LOCC1_G008013 [Lachnellula occidentalis]|uniref:MYND-type domain-containing protein n=1 Tax=Lachnellula occidentalis TaxID=215460 RepID=A0A8H8RL22_9HELO|nr:hypothetical protein LOCC1_G008013 [Lachnellula occidentalis]